MNYYLLSFWKTNGQKGYSQYNATSSNTDNLQQYAKAQQLEEDDMYSISLCKNGTRDATEGEVVRSIFFDNTHRNIGIPESVSKKVNSSINKSLQKTKEKNPLSRFTADELIQEAECLEEYGEYLHAPLIGYSAEVLRSYAEHLKEEPPREYYQTSDGWFDYYVNTETGEKKFHLDKGDILVDANLDEFSEDNHARK